MKNHTLIYSLGLAGLIPFIGSCIAVFTGWTILGMAPQSLFLSYSAIILSFLGGTLWGKSRELPTSSLSTGLLIFSNVLALLAWFMLLLGPDSYSSGLIIAILAYITIYTVERTNSEQLFASVGGSYLTLRLILTTTVCLSHVFMLLL